MVRMAFDPVRWPRPLPWLSVALFLLNAAIAWRLYHIEYLSQTDIGKVANKPLPDWARDFEAASWAQFFLKYLLGHGAVTVVIPGTDKPEHMADNLGAGRGRLPDAAQRQHIAQFIDTLG